MSVEACRTIARQRWGRCTAFRMGVVAGEIGARIVNQYRGRQADLFRQGLRRGRASPHAQLGVRDFWEVG